MKFTEVDVLRDIKENPTTKSQFLDKYGCLGKGIWDALSSADLVQVLSYSFGIVWLTDKGEKYLAEKEMSLENEKQCNDPHTVETFGPIGTKSVDLEEENRTYKSIVGSLCFEIAVRKINEAMQENGKLNQKLTEEKKRGDIGEARRDRRRAAFERLEKKLEKAQEGRTEEYRKREAVEKYVRVLEEQLKEEGERFHRERNQWKKERLAMTYGSGTSLRSASAPRQQGKSLFRSPIKIDFAEAEKRVAAFWLDECDEVNKKDGESDPHGTDPHTSGAKLDHGKNRLGLVLSAFSEALWQVGQVGTYGANKYTDNGWIEVPDGVSRYTDAMYRHLLKEAQGEFSDEDTNLPHAAHAAWNALARLDLMICKGA